MTWRARAAGALALLLLAVFVFGPREDVPDSAAFDAGQLDAGVDAYLARAESGVENLRPEAAKRVVWAGAPDTRTALSIVYLHGFSASAEEIRPVPDRVAQALGANLVFTRFTGHGRDGAALATATAADWMADTAEALALGRATGEGVIVIATSTGATFAALAAREPSMTQGVRGMVLISPNFGINNPLAPLLTWPAARHWLPALAGAERSFTPLNADHARHWTTRYPTTAVFPMAAAVRKAALADYGEVRLPVLFYYDDADQVVDARQADAVRATWGGPVTLARPPRGQGMDPFAHVVAGDILSPAGTDAATGAILAFIGGLP